VWEGQKGVFMVFGYLTRISRRVLDRDSSRAGFTIIELIATIVAAAIVTGIAIPTMENVKSKSYDRSTMMTVRALLTNVDAQRKLSSITPDWSSYLDTAVSELPADSWNWQLLAEGSQSASANQIGWSVSAQELNVNLISSSGRLCEGVLGLYSGSITTFCGSDVLVSNPEPVVTPSPTPEPTPTNPAQGGEPTSNLITEVPQGPPMNVTAALDSVEGRVTLTWTAVEPITTSTTTSPISGYRVFRLDPTVGSYVLEQTEPGTVATLPSGETLYTLGETVSFRVAAYNSAGEGPNSGTASTVVVGAPVSPTRQSSIFENDDFTISYSIIASSARPVDNATLLLNPRGSGTGNITSVLVVDGSTATSTIPTSEFVSSETYDVTVTLSNVFGSTTYADPLEVVVADTPTIPANLVWSFTENEGELALSWDPLEGTTARPLTGYRLFQFSSVVDGFVQVYQGADTTTTITGLELGTLARFMVAAYGSAGESARSVETTATPIGAPLEATVEMLSLSSGEAIAEFAFQQLTARPIAMGTLIATASGSPLSATIELDNANQVGSALFDTDVLERDATYSMTYTLQNDFGTSTYSAGTLLVPLSAPSAPAITGSVAGNGELSLTFNAPTSTGGAAILDYLSTCTDPSGAETARTTSTSPVLITGLTNEVNYSCVVAARSSAGIGVESEPITDRPTTAIYLPFTYSSDLMSRGHAMNGLFYYLGTAQGASTWANPNPSTVTTTSTATGTVPRTIYTDRTYGSWGSSALAAGHNVTFTLPSGVALRPTTFSFMANQPTVNDTYSYQVSSNGTSWETLSTFVGGACLDGYPNWWCYHDVSTTNSYRYHRIAFTNPANTRLYILEVELYGYYTGLSAPAAPTTPAVSQVASDAVKVTFVPSASGSPASSYTVTCTGSGGASTRSATTVTTSAYVTDLTPLGSYNCSARATNFAGGSTSTDAAITLQNSDVVARVMKSQRDTNGLFYYLGTNNGTTSFTNPCSSGTMMLTTTAGATSNKCANVDKYFAGVISSRVASTHTLVFGLPAGTAAIPTQYTVSGLNTDSAMNDWVLEGSNDLANWNTLHTATNETCLPATCSYQIEVVNTFYRYFRLVFSADGSRNRMYTNEIEIYGMYDTNI
jgi:type II secretory pathway pseudopilin PulG